MKTHLELIAEARSVIVSKIVSDNPGIPVTSRLSEKSFDKINEVVYELTSLLLDIQQEIMNSGDDIPSDSKDGVIS